MDGKLTYPTFVLCKKPHEKRPIRGEKTFFPKVPKTPIFGKIAKAGPTENFQKWPIFWANFARLKNRKYKWYHSLIGMDGKLNYHRFVLCKKPHEKNPIRRDMTFFPKVSKTAVFRKIAKGGPRENFQKCPIFWAKFGRLNK